MGSTPGGAITVAAAEHALRSDGQPLEAEWPYSPVTPAVAPGPCGVRWFGLLHRTKRKATNEIITEIGRNRPVLLVLRLTDEFYDVDVPWIIRATGIGHALHAVVAAGMGTKSDGKKYLLIRNSWGKQWADGGYAWLEVDYLNDNLIEWCLVDPAVR